MKKMIRNFVLVASVTAMAGLFPACSCGDDDDGNANPDAANPDAPGPDADPNAFPTLGTQVDRAGRPAITSALIAGILYADAPAQAALRDMYNSDDDPSTWAASYADGIGAHVGVLDSLDRLVQGGLSTCGNSFAFDAVNLYAPLAGVLAADVLLIDTSQAVCTQYLAIEAGVANDCGGRTPLMDVIDVTYNALALGALTGPATDNRPPTATANVTAFPFLGDALGN